MINRCAAVPVTLLAYWRKACHSPRYPGSERPSDLRTGLHIPSAAMSHVLRKQRGASLARTETKSCSLLTLSDSYAQFSITVIPSSRACVSKALSSSRRGVTAANFPLVGKGTHTSRPLGERNQAASTSNHEGTVAGSKLSFSSSRNANVVRPSPQHLSRGNCALSITMTCNPARVAVIAAAMPAGPAPTISRSQSDGVI